MDDILNNATNNDLEVDQNPTVETTASETEADNKPVSLDDAIELAFKKHESTDTPAAKEEPRKVVGGDERVKTDDGKQLDPVTGRELQPVKAPASWTPALREKWGTIDPKVQQFISDREKHINETLSKTAEERGLAKQFRDVLSPYEELFKRGGVSGVDHVKELLGHSKVLNTGTAQEKAHVLYMMINHFKPDPHTLTALFNGQMPGPTQAPRPQVDPNAEVERILAERQEQAEMGDVQTHMDAFANDPSHEFFHDVREMMGKIISADLVEGATLPELFKNAYDMAVARHPEIQQIIASRAQVTRPAVAQPTPTRKAVASVKPSPGSGKSNQTRNGRMSLDEAVDRAFKEHGVD